MWSQVWLSCLLGGFMDGAWSCPCEEAQLNKIQSKQQLQVKLLIQAQDAACSTIRHVPEKPVLSKMALLHDLGLSSSTIRCMSELFVNDIGFHLNMNPVVFECRVRQVMREEDEGKRRRGGVGRSVG